MSEWIITGQSSFVESKEKGKTTGPLRRRPHLKSRKGCKNCKKRHIKVRFFLFSSACPFRLLNLDSAMKGGLSVANAKSLATTTNLMMMSKHSQLFLAHILTGMISRNSSSISWASWVIAISFLSNQLNQHIFPTMRWRFWIISLIRLIPGWDPLSFKISSRIEVCALHSMLHMYYMPSSPSLRVI